jgi:hypothetical protein
MNLLRKASRIVTLSCAFVALGSALRAADVAPPAPAMPQLPVLEQLADYLGLNPEQVKALVPVVTKGKADLVALDAKGLSKVQMVQEATKIVKATNDEIRKQLTPEQLKKFDDLMAEAKKKLQEEAMKRSGLGGALPATGTP